MGPLEGIRVIELAGIGPAPFAAMLLADLGADIVRVDRRAAVTGGDPSDPSLDLVNRGRRSIGIDLKHPDGIAVLLRLVDGADVLIEGFRPGVAERLGFGPGTCLERNPRLVYGRMTGWGQYGPLAHTAGHDITYIAVSGALSLVGRAGERPVPPVNIFGDYGGGSMFLALGIAAALVERSGSGRGQVIDAAMTEGSAVLTMMFRALTAMGLWTEERGTNLLDSGAHFYDVYDTADGGHVAIGPIEPQFYAEFITRLGLDPAGLPAQLDESVWPDMKERLAAVFETKTRDEWVEVFAGSDACVAPVLTLSEAPDHPHNVARSTFVDIAGMTHAAPAPRFSRTPGAIQGPPHHAGQDTDEVLHAAGFTPEEIGALRSAGAIA